MIAILLDHQADPHIQTTSGRTAIDIVQAVAANALSAGMYNPNLKGDHNRLRLCLELLERAGAVRAVHAGPLKLDTAISASILTEQHRSSPRLLEDTRDFSSIPTAGIVPLAQGAQRSNHDLYSTLSQGKGELWTDNDVSYWSLSYNFSFCSWPKEVFMLWNCLKRHFFWCYVVYMQPSVQGIRCITKGSLSLWGADLWSLGILTERYCRALVCLPPLTETFMFLLSKFVYPFFSASFCITAFGVVCKAYEKMINWFRELHWLGFLTCCCVQVDRELNRRGRQVTQFQESCNKAPQPGDWLREQNWQAQLNYSFAVEQNLRLE